jgi:hypothetical protein
LDASERCSYFAHISYQAAADLASPHRTFCHTTDLASPHRAFCHTTDDVTPLTGAYVSRVHLIHLGFTMLLELVHVCVWGGGARGAWYVRVCAGHPVNRGYPRDPIPYLSRCSSLTFTAWNEDTMLKVYLALPEVSNRPARFLARIEVQIDTYAWVYAAAVEPNRLVQCQTPKQLQHEAALTLAESAPAAHAPTSTNAASAHATLKATAVDEGNSSVPPGGGRGEGADAGSGGGEPDANTVETATKLGESVRARCALSDRNLHSRLPLVPTRARLKRTCV